MLSFSIQHDHSVNAGSRAQFQVWGMNIEDITQIKVLISGRH